MATQNAELTFEWLDIKSDLSLSNGQKYTFENTGSFPVRVFEAATIPDPEVRGHVLYPYDTQNKISVTPADGVNVYARVIQKGQKGYLTVTEAV